MSKNQWIEYKLLIPAHNPIKYINGQIFAGLPNLKEVYLNKLKCLDLQVTDPDDILTLSAVVSENCGFYEDGEPVEMNFCDVKDVLRRVDENVIQLVNGASSENEFLRAQLKQKDKTIEELRSRIAELSGKSDGNDLK